MSEGNVYEAACEVREAVNDLKAKLVGQLKRIGRVQEAYQSQLKRSPGTAATASRRERFAAALAGVSITRTIGGTPPASDPERTRVWAARVWELADALDLADPQRPAGSSATPPADDGPIDLSEPLDDDEGPTLDDIYGPKPK